MNLHREVHFETAICEHLGAHGWLYAEGDASNYDRTHALYAANRLRVVRQVRHSPNNPQDALDLVLFVNGIAVATAELKSDFTQSVGDAVDQYRYDRHPHPKGGVVEPLLSFPGGALVHFAVSQAEAMMTTRLAGRDTRFLPFNLGHEGGAGNPPNPDGFATAYRV